VLLLAGLEMF